MNLSTIAAIAATFVLIVPSAQASGRAPSDPKLAALRSEFSDAVKKGQMASVSVGAFRDGEIIWAESFGFADREARIRATPETRYGLASLGKSITATAMMTLVEAGQVGLEDPVSKILGPGALRNVACQREPTVRQLLDMTAGIPHGAATYTDGVARQERQQTRSQAVVVFCPGDVFAYSNFSIALADQLVETASGIAFGDYLQHRLFAPLGMRHASLGTPTGYTPPAARYDGEGKRIGAVQTFPRSSRGMHASLIDLLNYAAFNLKRPVSGQKPILSSSSLDEMHLRRSDAPGAITALGWGSLDLPGGKRWLITNGNDLGTQSTLVAVPHAGIAVVVLSNSSGNQTDEFAIRAADILVPGLLAAFEAARGSYEKAQSIQEDPGWIGRWIGKVETADGPLNVAITVSPAGRVEAELSGQSPAPIADGRLAHGVFTGHFRGLLALEERSDTAHHIDLTLHRDGKRATGFLTANFDNRHGKFELPTAIVLMRQD